MSLDPSHRDLSTRTKRIRSLARQIVLAMLVTPAADAQPCFGPDQLVGPCCQIANPSLPIFPGVQLPGLGICFSNCQSSTTNNLRVDWPSPTLLSCTSYATTITVTDTNSTLPILTGTMILDYTRTFEEVDPNGNFHQVWRFAVKVDLGPALVGIALPCPTPLCIHPFGPQPTAFFYGYLDYAQPCGGAITENALVLHHACDFFIHRPALSSQPGAFHPNESYAIVAPVSAAQPFVIGNNIPASGPLFGEGVRTTPPILPSICLATDQVSNGQMTLLGAGCLCPFGSSPQQYWLRTFSGQLSCPLTSGAPGNFTALNVGFPNLLPWFQLMSASIGRWTNANLYPGNESAWADEGLFLQNTACTGPIVTVQYGGSTRFGWMLNHPVLIGGHTDLASNYFAPVGGPYPFPIFGNVTPTDQVTFVNVP